ncbi:MAG: hypothetical protein ACE5G2_00395 [Candidatus Krumholzibacteriia bacterium]
MRGMRGQPGLARAFAVFGVTALLGTGGAAGTEFVHIDHLGQDELEYEFFRLRRPLTVRVRCEGAGDDDGDMHAYGWILNARTREVEWALTHDNARAGEGDNYVFEGEIDLPAGDFAAYFAAYSQRYRVIKILGREFGRIWIDSHRRHRPRESRRWELVLETPTEGDLEAVEALRRLPDVDDPQAFVRFLGMGDDDFRSRGFTLPERMQISVYCQGESGSDARVVDIGWILNSDTRERVWKLGPDNFKHGGGAAKNKVSRETITLPAGNYVASYATDGSHSSGAWNAPPPYDPEGWGMILWAQSERDARRIQPYDEEEDPQRTIVALIRQRGGAYVSQGFTLERDTRVRVYAHGEYDRRHHEFADYGWIEEFETGHTVWTLSRRNTHHAGGAQQNRVADAILELQRGDYVAYYVTDGSHAYREWNDTPPHDPTHWGILISGVGRDFDPASVERFDAEERAESGKDFLVRLVRVRSGEHVRQDFSLDEPTRVHILALGEGLYREMYDYGWIEDVSTGSWVWEMKLRNTRHAGGAQKNRRFDGVVVLEAGEYEAHYVTDGSHAWNEWNQPRPRDPHSWGLTVTRIDNGR